MTAAVMTLAVTNTDIMITDIVATVADFVMLMAMDAIVTRIPLSMNRAATMRALSARPGRARAPRWLSIRAAPPGSASEQLRPGSNPRNVDHTPIAVIWTEASLRDVDCEVECESDCEVDGDVDRNIDCEGDSEGDVNCEGDSNIDCDGDSEGDVDRGLGHARALSSMTTISAVAAALTAAVGPAAMETQLRQRG